MKVPPRSSQQRRRPANRRDRQAAARRNRWLIRLVPAVVVVVVGVIVAVVATSGGSGTHEVIPPPVAGGAPTVQPPAVTVKNPTSIPGVTAYVTTGWPQASNNGPVSEALPHDHVDGPVVYSVSPPVGGDHNAVWMNCGVYSQPVPSERAVHNLEHGAVWITYRPSLPKAEVRQLVAFQGRQSQLQGGSRYVDVTPYTGTMPSPIVLSSWGFQLPVTSPTDPRMQQFVDTFRFSATYTPEYGGPCTGGVGRPIQP